MKLIMDGDACWPDLSGRKVLHTTRDMQVALLRGGMESGKASVTIRIDLDDETTVLAETSLELLGAAARAFKGATGE
jgi:hypothetical protein